MDNSVWNLLIRSLKSEVIVARTGDRDFRDEKTTYNIKTCLLVLSINFN